jgi:phospholipid/cholesterol/gamma-HCH transport system substrate-binding protein
METRANYFLIGLFTLLGFAGMVLFSLWFARVELDRQFAYYDVKFISVSGLSRASEVRFAGLPVGQVINVDLSPDGDGTVLVRLEVRADTPVRVDSEATIESQGVTGVSYVGISAGDPAMARLMPEGDSLYPIIPAGRSMLQSLTEDAPELVEEVLNVVRDLSDLLNPTNVQRIDNIIANVETATEGFAQALEDFTVVSASISGFAIEISNFNVMLESMTSKAELLFDTADQTLVAISDLAAESQNTMATGNKTLEQATGTLSAAEDFITTDLKASTAELSAGLGEARGEIQRLGEEARQMLARFTETGETATTRLREAEATIKATDALIVQLSETLDTMDAAAVSFDLLVTGDGATLVAEARAALAPIAKAAQSDLPAMVADIRAATATAKEMMATVGNDLTSASGKIDGLADTATVTLNTVTDSFINANETLTAINSALVVGERTLVAAERTLNGADRVINEDISAITTDLRRTLDTLDNAIAQVSADIPGVTADLKAASEAARQAFEDVSGIITASDPPIRDFTTTALPQFTRLARETRDLIRNLEQLTKQIQRDPARFFLGGDKPAYQR